MNEATEKQPPMVKACPFCAGTNIVLRSAEIGAWVGCNGSYSDGDCSGGTWGETAHKAVEAWNRRSTAGVGVVVRLDLSEMLGMWETEAEIPEDWYQREGWEEEEEVAA